MHVSSVALLLRDRRLWLLLGSAVVAFILGFIAIPDRPAITFVSRTGFWLVLVAFGIFVYALWQTYSGELAGWRWRTIDWITVAVIGLGGLVLLVHETFGFKIVMDELMLLGTSMAMHMDKTVLTPVRGNDIQGAFVIMDGMMDKRPLFFPFLLSLLHDLTGYRPANAFVLNGILTFVFLGLVNNLARRLAGRVAGWLAVALLAGLPLLGHNATGGGFELLNLVMILATLLLGVRFLERRDGPSLTAFCFSAILMAQVRYETVIFLLPVAVLIVWVWVREGKTFIAWPLILAPLLMIHYPLQHRIFDLRPTSWELASKPGFEKVFSPAYIFHGKGDEPGNLQHALAFFFAKPTNQPNSLVLSALGCIALPFFVLLVVRRLRTLGKEPPISAVTTLFAVAFGVQFALLMCYFWGAFDDPVIRRLSLPTHLALVIAIVTVLPQFARPGLVRGLLAIAVFGLMASGVPSMSAHAYSQEYLPARETQWRREFMADQPRRDYVVIDNESILWISHQISSTPMLQAGTLRKKDMIFLMRNRAFSNVFVFQRFDINPETGAMTLRKGDDLGPDYVLETVREERLQILSLSRISRVKEIRDSGGVSLTAPDPANHPVPKSAAEIEKARRVYLENFIKMLP